MMTIDEMLAVLKAYKEGKEIQFKNFSHEWTDFKDGEEPCWDFASNQYRVKPKTKTAMDYNPIKRMTREEAIANPQPVCVLTDADGEPQGVLVQALGERFVIEPKDFNDGEEMEWDEAMEALKEAGKATFNKQQAYIILFLLEIINAALSSIGGVELASHYWTATEYGSYVAWFVYFGSGNFGYTVKCNSFVVRASHQSIMI